MDRIAKFLLIFSFYYFTNIGLLKSQPAFVNLINLTNNTNMTPPPPDASALGRFGECPVSLYTGKANITIPLFDLQVSNFKMPINLTYNTSGNRIGDIASWVGMGWTLNAGGVITRAVKGMRDEFIENGFNSHAGQMVQDYFSDGICDWPNSNSNPDEIWALMQISEGVYDGEPDEYYFNFNNYSGKFIIDKDQHEKLIPLDGQIQISHNTINETRIGYPNHIVEFIITTPDGVKYYFGGSARDETVSEHTVVRLDDIDNFTNTSSKYPSSLYTGNVPEKVVEKPYFNSWYLYRIELPNAKGNISLSYETDRIKHITNFNDVYFNDLPPNNTLDYKKIQRTYMEYYIDTKRLSGIDWNGGHMIFTKNITKRIDVDRYTNDPIAGYALGSIQIYNYRNQLIKNINLSTSYFLSLNCFSSTDIQECPGFYNRLRLDGISVNDQNYNFTYDTQQMPARYSPKMDFWGYYKNIDQNTYKIARPLIYVYPADINNSIYKGIYSIYPRSTGGNVIILPGSDRNPDPINAQANILKQIKYPTGGTDDFEYELNKFMIDGTERSGGGLRIKRITSYDGLSHSNDIVRDYSYSIGKILQIPEFAKYNISNYYHAQSTSGVEYWTRISSVFSLSTNSLGLTQGGNVGYPEVTERIVASGTQNQLNGKNIFYYSFPGDYSSQTDLCNVCGYTGCMFTKNSPIVNIYNYSELEYLNEGYGDPNYDKYDNYPFLENPDIDFGRGLLLKEEFYDNNNNLVRKKENEYCYHADPNIVYSVKVQYYSKEHYLQSIFGADWEALITYNMVAADLRWGLRKNVIGSAYLKKETETIYDLVSSISLSKITEYTYNSLLQVSQISTTNSDGCTIKNKFLYPPDYTFTGTPSNNFAQGIKIRKDKNQIDEPIEHVISKTYSGNEVVASGTLSLHTVRFSDNVFPGTIKKLESSSPISGFQLSTINSNNLTYDNHYQDSHSFDSYSQEPYPLLVQQHKTNDINTSYKWGYDYNYPVVKAENITSDVLENVINQIRPDFLTFLEGLGDLTSAESKGNWKTFNNNLRANSNLSGALITTYTFKPLVGVTSITDPAGFTKYLEYDSSGRLIIERDDDGNILKKYEYHYAN